jgi:hypothetical protein
MTEDEKFLEQAFERPVAYRPVIAKALGSVKLGLLISQLYYWKDKGNDEDGWIYKTRDAIYDETALSRSEQETAREKAREMGILSEIRKGIPRKVYYKINIADLAKILREYQETNQKPSRRKTSQQVCESIRDAPTGRQETSRTAGERSAKREGEYQPNYYTENTTKTTARNTAESTRLSSLKNKYARFDRP